MRERESLNLKFISTMLFAVTFLVGGFFISTGTAFAETVANQVDHYTVSGDAGFSRSLTQMTVLSGGGTISQTTDNSSVTATISNTNTYSDSGFYTNPMKLGDVKSVTITGTGSYGLNLWLDAGGDGKFFTWTSDVFSDGLNYTSGDGFFSEGSSVPDINGTLTINDDSSFHSYNANLYPYNPLITLGELKLNYPLTTKIAFWVGTTVLSGGNQSATITAFNVVAPVPMAINSSLPIFTAGVEAPFSVSTVANDDAGKMVRAYFTIPAGASVKYEYDGAYYPLTDGVYGPDIGFPVSNATSLFKAIFPTVGSYPVTVEFKLVDGGTVVATKNITATVVAPMTGSVAITGTAKFGETLTADISELTNVGTSPIYQWSRHWTDINGSGSDTVGNATSSTYLLGETDIGKTIKVEVTAQSGVGTGSIPSDPTDTILKASSTTVVTCTGDQVYTGLALTPCTVLITGAGELSLTQTPVYTNNTNAGTATASYTFTGDANHEGSSDSKTFVITRVIHNSGGSHTQPATPAIPAKVETPDGCAAGNKFSTTTGRNCNAATPAVPAGQVLGASTQAGQVLGADKFNFTILVKNGSKGNEIIELQKLLTSLGYDLGIADGKFGPKTKGAVIKFQIVNGLKGDGVVGPLTRAILNK